MIKFNLHFGGFYESIHDWQIDSMLESYFTSESGEEINTPENINYSLIRNEYVKNFLPLWADNFEDDSGINGLNFKYIKLDSPREYNFITDTIVCGLSEKDYKLVKKHYMLDNVFVEYVNEASQAHDGFASFYSGIELVSTESEIFMEYLSKYLLYKNDSDYLDLLDTPEIYELLHNIDFY